VIYSRKPVNIVRIEMRKAAALHPVDIHIALVEYIQHCARKDRSNGAQLVPYAVDMHKAITHRQMKGTLSSVQ
jgi:hypothetical protein